MKRLLLRYSLVAGFVLAAAFITHGQARAAGNNVCNLTQTTSLGGDLFAAYDVFAAAKTYSVSSGTLKFKCTQLVTSPTTVTMYFLGASSTQGSYAPPALSGPGSSALQFMLCLPGVTSANCSPGNTSNVWTATNGYAISGVTTQTVISVPQFAAYAAQQNVYVGTSLQYSTTVNFAFGCGTPTPTPC